MSERVRRTARDVRDSEDCFAPLVAVALRCRARWGCEAVSHSIFNLMNLKIVRPFSVELNFSLRLAKINAFMNRTFLHGKCSFVPREILYQDLHLN